MNNAYQSLSAHVGLNKPKLFSSIASTARLFGLVALLGILMVGCGGGADTEKLPNTNTQAIDFYTGPKPATTDVQSFKTNVWDNLVAENRCGACHGASGGNIAFVHEGDINIAYSEANKIVTLSAPGDSRMVAKVAGGHNCWLESTDACADTLTRYIAGWAGGTGAASSKEIQLDPPSVIKDPGQSLNFPSYTDLQGNAGQLAAYTTIHNLLTQYCDGCHTNASDTPQSPYFASDDLETSYAEARSKINLDTPSDSRFVNRLGLEFHNCWSSCSTNASEMQQAIEAFAGQLSPTAVDPNLKLSKALSLANGIVASGGSRHEANVIALWEFKTGQGNTAFDTSGIEPSIHLTMSGDVSWVGGYGIEIKNGKAQGSTTASKKLHDLIKSTSEYSIEAWVVPANVTQEGPARIISYSAGTNARNFTLGQTLYNYDFLHRSSTTDGNGDPAHSTNDADEDLQATQQHVVVTFDPVNGRRTYVNGLFTDDIDQTEAGNLSEWDDAFAFVLGNEISGDRLWQGKLRLVAIHNRALTQAQIIQNFEVGVGEKFFLLFSVTELLGSNAAPEQGYYVMFEVSQFDSYSYLFDRPTFVSLDPNANIDNFRLRGMRIGVNGKESQVGQAYANLDTTVTLDQYQAGGQRLSNIGTIVGLEKGVDVDEFFLSFDELAGQTSVRTPVTEIVSEEELPLEPEADIGLRTFDEINATMAQITGVDPTSAEIGGDQGTYTTVKQQLPTSEKISGFLSAHQVGVSQLAIEYCNALVEDGALRSQFFGSFNFDANVATAFGSGDSAQKNQVLNALYNKMIGLPGTGGVALTSGPSLAEVKQELLGSPNGLYDRLTQSCPTGCDATRTKTIVKSMCAAVLGSAAMLVQ